MRNIHPIRRRSAVAVALQCSTRQRALALALFTIPAIALLVGAAVQARAETATVGVVYTADEHGNSVSRIDLASAKVDTFPVGATPHNVRFVSGKNMVLAVGTPMRAETDRGHAEADDTHGTDSHGGGGHGDAEAGGVLIVMEAGRIATGPVASVEVNSHPAHVIADPVGERAFVTNSGDDTVSVVDLARGEVIKEIATGEYPHGLRMSPDGGTIYVANVEGGTVSVIDAASLEEIDRIEVGETPVQVGFTPDGKQVYVSLRDENKLAIIDTATRQVTARIVVGSSPIQVHATPDGRFVYVANQGTEAEPDETVSVIDVVGGLS